MRLISAKFRKVLSFLHVIIFYIYLRIRTKFKFQNQEVEPEPHHFIAKKAITEKMGALFDS